MFKKIKLIFKKYFIAGFLVLVPLGATFSLLRYLIKSMDGLLRIDNGHFLYILPAKYHPDSLLHFHIPGLGLIITILIIILVGIVFTNILGRTILKWNEMLIDKIPFVRSIYNGLKMFMQAIFSSNKDHFRRVVLVEMFRKGTYVLAFVTGPTTNELKERVPQKVINVFIPTTPNPTSGFYVMVPEDESIPLTMSVEEAFKVIMSAGILTPEMSPEIAAQVKNGTLPKIAEKRNESST